MRRGEIWKRVAIVLTLVCFAIGVIGGAFAGSDSPRRCAAHSANCRQTADGQWVPLWYFTALRRAQRTDDPSARGAQPTPAQERAAGAPKSVVASEAGGGGDSGGGDRGGGGADGGGGDGGGGGGADAAGGGAK